VSGHGGTRLWFLGRAGEDETALAGAAGKPKGKPKGKGKSKDLEQQEKEGQGQQDAGGEITPERVPLPASCSGFAHALAFTQDSRRLALSLSEGALVLVNVEPGAWVASVGGVINHKVTVLESRFDDSGRDGLECAVAGLALSRDGASLAVFDSLRRVYVYEVDTLRLLWRLPICPAPVTSVSFHPHSPFLVVLLASQALLVFDLVRLNVTPKSQAALEGLPGALAAVPGPLESLCFDPSPSQSRLFLHSQGGCVFLDLAADLPSKAKIIVPALLGQEQEQEQRALRGKEKKRAKREAAETGPGLSVVTSYRSIVHVGCIEGQQLVSPLPLSYLSLSLSLPFQSFIFLSGPIRRRPIEWPLTQETPGTRTDDGVSLLGAGRQPSSRGLEHHRIACSGSVRSLLAIAAHFHLSASLFLSLPLTLSLASPRLSNLIFLCLSLALPPRAWQVLVENPWARVLEQLPDTLQRKRYAT
jgi:hypothetical protein